MGIIEFNGISSKDLGVEVETFPDYVAPEKEYQVTHVPGRNGDLVVDTKTFQNVPRSYEVSVATNGVPIDVVNAAVARFKSSSRMPIKSLVSQIVAVESGNGQPKSPTNPYTISGFDSAVVTRCGKNLCNWKVNTTSYPLTISLPKGTYTISSDGQSTFSFWYFRFTDINGNVISDNPSQFGLSGYNYSSGSQYFYGGNNRTNVTFILPNNGYTVRIGTLNGNGTVSAMLEIGDTATTYEAYNGNTYTFTFGQTVYGGQFDNKGNLVVTDGAVLIGDLTWTEQSIANHVFTAIITGKKNAISSGVPDNISCEIYDTLGGDYVISGNNNSIGGSTANSRIFICDTRFNSASDFKTACASYKIKYELATPITLAITSQDIPTLLGENNIFSNCGDVSVKVEPSFSTIINQVVEWLHSASGYARLEDTYDSDHYRMAYYSESLSVENLFNEAGKATLNFICKPQRYLKSGETPVVFTEEGTIQNGTRFSSSPVLKVTTDNTQGSVSIGNHTITIKAGAGTDPITIDCELQDAWSGTSNKNSYIVLTDGEFPVIDPGTQTVTFDGGVQSVEVIPRWWTV